VTPPRPAATTAPRVETARLVLRGHRPDDLDAYAALWGDPDVTRHIGGRPFGRPDCWQRLLRGAGHWALLGYGMWVIEEKASGRLVGEVGYFDGRREMSPPLGAHEMGWVLVPPSHGRGYATEACLAARAWAAAHVGPVATACIIAPENVASLRVAAKLGYREVRRTTYEGETLIVLAAALG
jgi:RimJ/RimL family protein N-acetyltransferase